MQRCSSIPAPPDICAHLDSPSHIRTRARTWLQEIDSKMGKFDLPEAVQETNERLTENVQNMVKPITAPSVRAPLSLSASPSHSPTPVLHRVFLICVLIHITFYVNRETLMQRG